MKNMSFVMTPEEVKTFKEGTYMTTGARLDGFEGIYVSWATDPAAIKAVLPAPLEMAFPIATAYIANIENANYALPYLEAGIGVPATYQGVMGFYFINFQLYGDGAQMATFLGRESGGIPKKFADKISLTRVGDSVKAYVERDGIRLIDVEAEIGKYNTPDAAALFGAFAPGTTADGANYLVKFDANQQADGTTIFEDGVLRRSLSKTAVKDFEPATAKVTLMPSENDPWASLPVAKVIGAGYVGCDMHLVADGEVAKIDMNKELAKVLKGKFDTVFLGKPNSKF